MLTIMRWIVFGAFAAAGQRNHGQAGQRLHGKYRAGLVGALAGGFLFQAAERQLHYESTVHRSTRWR